MKSRIALPLVWLLAATLPVAHAQEGALQDEEAPPAEASRQPIDEIIVTAQKREQRLLDVGVTVTAIDSDTLRDARVQEMRELATYVPNVDIREQAPGVRPVITIRGVGLNDFSNVNNPSAGIYVDEVYMSSLGLMSFDFYDLERVEVLKGPQGTLYGRNSTAGAINFITARPHFDGMETMLSTSYGNFSTLEAEGMGNIPLGDTLALRVSARTIQQFKGYYFNRTVSDDIGERDIFMGRAQLRWRPAGADINLKLEGFRADSGIGQGHFFGSVDPGNPPNFTCEALLQGRVDRNCTSPFGYSNPDGGPFTGDWAEENFRKHDQIGATLRAVFDLGPVELTSVTGFLDADSEEYADLDASPDTLLEFIPTTDVEQYSQEFRLAGAAGPRLGWLFGTFWSHDRIQVGSTGIFDDLFMTRSSGFGDQKTDSAAGFAHLEFGITDTLTAIGGLRLTWERKRYTAAIFDTNPFGTSCLLSPTCSPGPTDPVRLAATVDDSGQIAEDRISDTKWSWKAGLDWKPAPDTLVYGSVTQGIKSGGFFFGFTFANDSFLPYKPESLIAYEVGVKHQVPDGSLRLAASAFYYDYKDIQSFVRDEATEVAQRLGNIDEATLFGADLEVAMLPAEGLTIAAGVGWLSSELGAFPVPGPGGTTVIVPKGNDFPNAPKVTFNTLARYERPIGANFRGLAQIDGRYSASTEKNAANDRLIAADRFTLWNARIAASPQHGGWEFALWAKNIFDETYKVQGVNLTAFGGVGYENVNPPRTYGGTLTLSF